MLKALPLGEKIPFKIPGNTISAEGEAAIKKYVTDKYGYSFWHREDGVDWVWQNQRGTLPKRLASHLYKSPNCKLRLTETDISMIGNIAQLHCNKVTDYLFDFTNKFDWPMGAFGDAGSCFGNRRHTVLYSMEQDGYLAMRFFNPTNPAVGVARAFVYPREQYFIVFNGYGMEKLSIARILATWLGYTYRHVIIENTGKSGEQLFINRSADGQPGSGYLVFDNTNADVHRVDNVDLKTDIRFNIANGFECQYCGIMRRGDQLDRRCDALHSGITHRLVCVGCFDVRFYLCAGRCGKYHRTENALRHIDEAGVKQLYCRPCFKYVGVRCKVCRRLAAPDSMLYENSNNEMLYYCQHHFGARRRQCCDCRNTVGPISVLLDAGRCASCASFLMERRLLRRVRRQITAIQNIGR
jgi:hypothetical protein